MVVAAEAEITIVVNGAADLLCGIGNGSIRARYASPGAANHKPSLPGSFQILSQTGLALVSSHFISSTRLIYSSSPRLFTASPRLSTLVCHALFTVSILSRMCRYHHIIMISDLRQTHEKTLISARPGSNISTHYTRPIKSHRLQTLSVM